MSQPILMWFRADLRVADNPALHAAVAAGNGVVAVFCLCPAQWAAHDDAPVKLDFWLRSLRALSADLAALGIALRIVDAHDFAGVPDALAEIAAEYNCAGLVFNREHAINEQSRDDAVIERFELDGRTATSYQERCIFEPGTVRTGSGGYYSVYTPFRKAWLARVETDRRVIEPIGTPPAASSMIGTPDDVPGALPHVGPDVGPSIGPDGAAVAGVSAAAAAQWPAGAAAAHDRLLAFIDERVDAYHDARDLPGEDGVSAVSPYLVAGVLSLRQCVHAVVEANEGRLDEGSRGAVVWLQELIWREFYQHVLVGFPRVCRHQAFVPWTEEVIWRDDPAHVEAWQQGRTGVPIVDAGMRQLIETGWMHNRVRMITAMFFSKNLLLNWRIGERWFMQQLVDGDIAANNGGWQWSASTGTDAAPYFRIFNPWSQSAKCDPDGRYIRRYVRELEGVPAAALHDPDRLAAALEGQTAYPAPIVDAKVTRAAAIEAFKVARTAADAN